ncbi:MAG: NAD(P)H-dependent oxidoreductase [Flavobacteriaceae bacterium]|nr:NAD(P)H-dependent oxidoreductase [Flavobacteriaceae bacterium]
MKKIVLIAGTNSSNSINRILLKYVASQLKNASFKELLMTDFELPLYGIDYENQNGIPTLAHHFKLEIKACDGILISLAEHNGAYTVAFKNILDWISRIESDVWLNKPMLAMATSPGKRGAIGVLEMFYSRYSLVNGNLLGKFSLPYFSKNFDEAKNLLNEPYHSELGLLIERFQLVIGTS